MPPILGVLAAALLGMVRSYPALNRAQATVPAGVVHVRNSETPAKGTVKLEAEKVLTINPYDQPEVGSARSNSSAAPAAR